MTLEVAELIERLKEYPPHRPTNVALIIEGQRRGGSPVVILVRERETK